MSNYEAATGDHPTVGKFLATLKMEKPGIITFVPTSQDEEWTVKFVRHKIRTIHSFHPPNYVVSISTVNECEISDKDISPALNLDTGKHKSHIEVEVSQVIAIVSILLIVCTTFYASYTTFFGKLGSVISWVSLQSNLLHFLLNPTRFLYQ